MLAKNLSLLDNSQIEAHLTSNSLKVGVVGIGRIGLPTALCFANSGFETIGIDINDELVSMVNSGDYPLKDEPGFAEIFENVRSQKKFVATTDLSKITGLGEARAKKLKKILQAQSKHLKKTRQKTLHDS